MMPRGFSIIFKNNVLEKILSDGDLTMIPIAGMISDCSAGDAAKWLKLDELPNISKVAVALQDWQCATKGNASWRCQSALVQISAKVTRLYLVQGAGMRNSYIGAQATLLFRHHSVNVRDPAHLEVFSTLEDGIEDALFECALTWNDQIATFASFT